MTDAAPEPKRPVILTVVLVLAYLSALVDVLVGVAIFLSRYDVPDDQVLLVTLMGSAVILLGLLQLAIAGGVGRGSHLSRILLTVFIGTLLALDASTLAVDVYETGAWNVVAVADVVVEMFVIAAMWVPPGSRWFRAVAAAKGTVRAT